MEKIEEFTRDLFVVKPSIVKLDTPIYKDNDFIHIVKFEQRPKDVTIATRRVAHFRNIDK